METLLIRWIGESLYSCKSAFKFFSTPLGGENVEVENTVKFGVFVNTGENLLMRLM